MPVQARQILYQRKLNVSFNKFFESIPEIISGITTVEKVVEKSRLGNIQHSDSTTRSGGFTTDSTIEQKTSRADNKKTYVADPTKPRPYLTRRRTFFGILNPRNDNKKDFVVEFKPVDLHLEEKEACYLSKFYEDEFAIGNDQSICALDITYERCEESSTRLTLNLTLQTIGSVRFKEAIIRVETYKPNRSVVLPKNAILKF